MPCCASCCGRRARSQHVEETIAVAHLWHQLPVNKASDMAPEEPTSPAEDVKPNVEQTQEQHITLHFVSQASRDTHASKAQRGSDHRLSDL